MLFLSWKIHLLTSDMGEPSSPAFGLRLGLIPLAPLVLRPLNLYWKYTINIPGLQLGDDKLWDFLVMIT